MEDGRALSLPTMGWCQGVGEQLTHGICDHDGGFSAGTCIGIGHSHRIAPCCLGRGDAGDGGGTNNGDAGTGRTADADSGSRDKIVAHDGQCVAAGKEAGLADGVD